MFLRFDLGLFVIVADQLVNFFLRATMCYLGIALRLCVGFELGIGSSIYIHDSSSSNQVKDMSNNIVIFVIEGPTPSRQIEWTFNIYLGFGWRCATRPIGRDTYVI